MGSKTINISLSAFNYNNNARNHCLCEQYNHFYRKYNFWRSVANLPIEKNGINVGANTTTCTLASLTNNDSVYCVLTPSSATCASIALPAATSNHIITTVANGIQPSIKINPSAVSVCAGTTVNFTTSVLNAGTSPTYQWKLNSTILANVTGNAYSNATLNNNDTIICSLIQAARSCYASTSDTVIMTVSSLTQPSVSIAASANNICKGSTVLFSSTAQNLGLGPIYQWKINGNNVGGNTSTFSTAQLQNSDTLSCDVNITSPCSTLTNILSNKIIVTIKPILASAVTITANQPLPICPSTNVMFTTTATNGGVSPTYQWEINNTDIGTTLQVTPVLC